jgi:hypothetical protein
MKIWLLLIAALALGALGAVYRRSRAWRLPDISDKEFLNGFEGFRTLKSQTVLRERRRIAKILGLPPNKLAPDQKLEELSRQFEYMGQFSVAWSDLDDEVRALRRAAGIREDVDPPSTVGELIAELSVVPNGNSARGGP